jgi:hypothetical protein
LLTHDHDDPLLFETKTPAPSVPANIELPNTAKDITIVPTPLCGKPLLI